MIRSVGSYVQGAIKYGTLAEFLPGNPNFNRKFRPTRLNYYYVAALFHYLWPIAFTYFGVVSAFGALIGLFLGFR